MGGRAPTWCRRAVDARARCIARRDAQRRPRSSRWRSCFRTTTLDDSSVGDVTRILIADDHALLRSGLRALFESMEGIEVVGEAPTGREAVELAEKLKPEIVIM